MIIGVPKEIKTNENRIALVPAGAESLTAQGHTVLVEQGAGIGSGFPDAAYAAVGACIVATADEVWQKAEMIMKVKEPIEVEWPRMRRGQLIYTYFHFAASEKLTRAVIDSGAACRCSRAPSTSRRSSAAAACCSAACPAWRPVKWSSSAAASWAPTRRRWPPASART
jgi:alanine dehydrogenase